MEDVGAGRSKSPRGLCGSRLDVPWFCHILRGFPLHSIKSNFPKKPNRAPCVTVEGFRMESVPHNGG